MFVPVICLVLFFPINAAFSYLNEEIYLLHYQKDLETIANDVLDKKITTEQANQKLTQMKHTIHISSFDENAMYVDFVISGITDNCYGITYSKEEMKINNGEIFCCGEITSWSKIKNHWYSWTTT